MKTKPIELPDELFDMNIFKKVQNRVNNILYRIAKTEVLRSPDRFVKDKSNKHILKLDEAVIKCCNYDFKECFEEFYCILKNMI